MTARPQALILLLLLGVGTAAAAAPPPEHPPTLRLTPGDFRPLDGASVPSWLRALAEGAAPSGRSYRIVITRGPLAPAERKRLEAAGAEVLGYLPVNGYRVRIAPGAARELQSLPFVDWVGALPERFKIEPELARGVESRAGTTRLRAILAAGESAERTLDPLADLETLALPSGKDGAWRVTAEVPAARLTDVLTRLAALPEVEAVESVREMRLLNQDAVWVHQSYVGPSPQQTPLFDRGIFGCGQIVAFADTGQDYDLCYFRDTVNGRAAGRRAALQAPCPAADAADEPAQGHPLLQLVGHTDRRRRHLPGDHRTSGHGTHTSGSIAGDQPPYADCSGFTTPGRSGGDGHGAGRQAGRAGDGRWRRVPERARRNGVESGRRRLPQRRAYPLELLGRRVPRRVRPVRPGLHAALRLVCARRRPRDVDLPRPAPRLLGRERRAVLPAAARGRHARAREEPARRRLGRAWQCSQRSVRLLESRADGRREAAPRGRGAGRVHGLRGLGRESGEQQLWLCSLDGTSMSSPTTAGLAALVREYYTAGFYAAGVRAPAAGLRPAGRAREGDADRRGRRARRGCSRPRLRLRLRPRPARPRRWPSPARRSAPRGRSSARAS